MQNGQRKTNEKGRLGDGCSGTGTRKSKKGVGRNATLGRGRGKKSLSSSSTRMGKKKRGGSRTWDHGKNGGGGQVGVPNAKKGLPWSAWGEWNNGKAFGRDPGKGGG